MITSSPAAECKASLNSSDLPSRSARGIDNRCQCRPTEEWRWPWRMTRRCCDVAEPVAHRQYGASSTRWAQGRVSYRPAGTASRPGLATFLYSLPTRQATLHARERSPCRERESGRGVCFKLSLGLFKCSHRPMNIYKQFRTTL